MELDAPILRLALCCGLLGITVLLWIYTGLCLRRKSSVHRKDCRLYDNGLSKALLIPALMLLGIYVAAHFLLHREFHWADPDLGFCLFLGGQILFLLPCCVYGRWYFIIHEGTLSCRSLWGRKQQIQIQSLSGYTYGKGHELILMVGDSPFFTVKPGQSIPVITQVLDRRNVPFLDPTEKLREPLPDSFTVRASLGRTIALLLVFLPGTALMAWIFLCRPSLVTLALLLILVFGLGGPLLQACTERVRVENGQIRKTRLFHKTLILPFDQVEKSDTLCENKALYLCLYTGGKPVIKVMKGSKNADKLQALAIREGWDGEEEEFTFTIRISGGKHAEISYPVTEEEKALIRRARENGIRFQDAMVLRDLYLRVVDEARTDLGQDLDITGDQIDPKGLKFTAEF